MRKLIALIFALACCAMAQASTSAVRLKDLGKFAGWRENALVGYGVVTGLAGTGDSSTNQATRQALANLLTQFDQSVTPEQVQSRNVAAVMVTATLPAFAAEGDVIDVTVTSMGDARSLTGGSLVLASLKAANGKVYALAQGAVSVGGYKYDMNGNVQQKNHPTVGTVPSGGVIEVGVGAQMLDAHGRLTFKLSEADYTTAARVAAAINQSLGPEVSEARDAEAIVIQVPPASATRLPEFISRIEKLSVEPDRRARVVINERTGTVVSGGDVSLAKVVISHGDLKISVLTDNSVSQPIIIGRASAQVGTAIVSNSRIDVQERAETGLVRATNNTVADLIEALVGMKTNTRDIISILQAVKAQGAMRAELVIQ
jgi:flagellar P-ring protein precursor FlgI